MKYRRTFFRLPNTSTPGKIRLAYTSFGVYDLRVGFYAISEVYTAHRGCQSGKNCLDQRKQIRQARRPTKHPEPPVTGQPTGRQPRVYGTGITWHNHNTRLRGLSSSAPHVFAHRRRPLSSSSAPHVFCSPKTTFVIRQHALPAPIAKKSCSGARLQSCSGARLQSCHSATLPFSHQTTSVIKQRTSCFCSPKTTFVIRQHVCDTDSEEKLQMFLIL
jgi:hypothetical protein